MHSKVPQDAVHWCVAVVMCASGLLPLLMLVCRREQPANPERDRLWCCADPCVLLDA